MRIWQTKAGYLTKVTEYAARFSYAKVSGIDQYMEQTFGGTLQSVQAASRIAGLVSAVIVLLVTLLFMKMLTAKTGIPLLCCGPLDLPAQTLNGSMPGARFWYCPQGYYWERYWRGPWEKSCPLQQRPGWGRRHSALPLIRCPLIYIPR